VVDVSGVRNPLWMPKNPVFTFIADPNRYKAIDVPFFVAGVVEGNVVRRIGSEDRPVAGLKVHLHGLDSDVQMDLPTFSDGSFYHMGLTPGRYEVQVDSMQLAILGVTARPATRIFTVHETPSGDVVEGLDFVLVPLPTERSAQKEPTNDRDEAGISVLDCDQLRLTCGACEKDETTSAARTDGGYAIWRLSE